MSRGKRARPSVGSQHGSDESAAAAAGACEMLPAMGHSDDVLNGAATWSSAWVGSSDPSDYYLGSTMRTLQLLGYQLAKHITSDDRRGVFAPARIVRDNKEQIGGVLALDCRAIVAWSRGVFRQTEHAEVLRYDEVDAVVQRPRNAGALGTPLEIRAASTWRIVVTEASDSTQAIGPVLADLLRGQMIPEPVPDLKAVTERGLGRWMAERLEHGDYYAVLLVRGLIEEMGSIDPSWRFWLDAYPAIAASRLGGSADSLGCYYSELTMHTARALPESTDARRTAIDEIERFQTQQLLGVSPRQRAAAALLLSGPD